MPPRPSPSSAGKPRRRPGPVMPGSWIWLVMLALVVGMFLLSSLNSPPVVSYGEFLRLLFDDSQNISQIVYVGTESITVDVNDTDKLSDDLKKQMRGGKSFSVSRPAGEDQELTKRINELGKKGVKVEHKDSSTIMPTLMLFLLPTLLLLAVFLFILPRFRDPLGGGFLSNYINSFILLQRTE